LLQEGAINWDTYGRAIMMVNEQYEEATKQTKEFNRLATDLGMSIASSFENAILTGKKLSDTLRDLAQDVARILMRQAITEPLAAGISGALAGAFGGARANGGPVTGGGTYMVGERGPELFVPNTSGMIVPHEALQGGGGGVTVQQTINVTTGVQQTVRAEILSLMPQISNAAKAAVADAKLRGGSYSAALR
jgi:phage-related minor tail protein